MTAERPVCEICGGTEVERAFDATDRNRKVDDRRFTVHVCRTCGAGWTLPRPAPAELAAYYTREYYSLDANAALERALRPYARERVRRIRRFAAGGRLLDVGAGTGMFLKTAVEEGFDAEGLELDGDAAALGAAAWGLRIRRGDLFETDLPAGAVDVVTLGHVFEHLRDPRAAARRLHMLLKPGGLLVVAVPNFASVQARFFRAAWFHLDVPRHLFHYTPAAMERILTGAGFRIAEVSCFSAQHNWAGILGSVMDLSRPGETLPHKLIRKAIGTPTARALAWVEAAAGRGGTFEVYALKP
jgi:2-polyprenyl-3-methyl-5-hydroxy-6-metoxy-1,4-benzoquinol methylase